MGARKNTIEKYIKVLEKLKYDLDNKNIYELQYIRQYPVNCYWATWLKKNGIIYKDHNKLYRWNDKIPISVLLINKFRKDIYIQNTKSKQKKLNYIEDNQQTLFTNKNKKVIKNVDNTIIPKVNNEYGVIRRFIKWLW